MDAVTLTKLTTRIDLPRAQALLPGLLKAWELAEVNTVKRRAMWFGQVLEESVGLAATTEYASGYEYEGRSDLGNTHTGDGPRFKGRGFIQLTGRSNYGRFSQWCFSRGLVPTSYYFLDHPEEVANDEFAWISAAFYWMGNHNHGYGYLNLAADASDLVAATYMVNGGQNGFDTRKFYYNKALALGNELLGGSMPADHPDWSDMATKAEIQQMIDNRIAAAVFGGNVNLHKARPVLYPDAANGLLDQMVKHAQRLNAQAAVIRSMGGHINDVDDDVTAMQKNIAAMQKEMNAQ